jgi:hypothetical protein
VRRIGVSTTSFARTMLRVILLAHANGEDLWLKQTEHASSH